ncbi:MAG: hypothetical protein IJW18_03335 [Lachnospiraceae bacterium]|nr:hypothetical protein [Lachnospiraceae bacterium]
MEKMGLVVGIDISKDAIRLAYWKNGMPGPEMLTDEEDKECFWSRNTNDELSEIIKNVVCDALKRLGEAFDKVIFTMPDAIEPKFMTSLESLIEGLCPTTSEIRFISHSESSAHYSLNQKKELRMNDVAFFDFSRAGLMYRRMHVANSGGKINALVGQKDCSGTVNMELLTSAEMKKMMDENFKVLLGSLLDKQQISTVYLTGEGFENEDWAVESLNMLCKKRRVFKGGNLYAVGACYMGMKSFVSGLAPEYRVFCEGRTVYETCVEVILNGERSEAVLVPASKLWYEADNTIEGYLSGASKVVLTLRSYFGREVLREEIMLEELGANVSERMARVQIKATMPNTEELLISISNLGFGEFAPKSDTKVERIIKNDIFFAV